MRVRRFLRNLLRYTLLAGITLFTILPLYWLFLVSVRSRVELFGAPSFIQTSVYIENYTKPFFSEAYQRYLLNSIVIATSNTILVVLLAIASAYALSRCRLAGEENIFFWTITNRMAPPAAFLLPIFILYTRVFTLGDAKMFDTHFGLILLYCVFNLPFAIWLLKGIIDSIPTEIDEAAMVDGAGLWMTLLQIIVPLAAPGIAITAILSWIFAWNEYLFAATLTSVHARTITTGLAEFVTVTGTNWGEMAAVAVVALLPALLFVALVQRYIITGLTFGAVRE
ncbi:MAG: sugar ABC transporter [Nitrospiraceae bacterium]